MENFSKQTLTNLLAEFILSKIGHDSLTLIEVVDCENFIVIKGKTDSQEILNLNEVKTFFSEEFDENFKLTHTIDLIEYGCKMKELEELEYIFFNSPNLKLCQSVKSNLTTQSVFPYGCSLKMGKNLFFYAKHIAYNLQSKYNFEKIKIKIYRVNNEELFEIYVDSCESQDEKIKSAILDSFDFRFTRYNKKLLENVWKKEFTEKNFEFDFIKELNEGLVII